MTIQSFIIHYGDIFFVDNSIWFDKYKYDDAEEKYHAKEAGKNALSKMDPETNKIKSKSKNKVVGVGAGVGSGVGAGVGAGVAVGIGAGVGEGIGVCKAAKNDRKGKTNQKGKVVKTEKKESNEESVSKNIAEDKDDRTLEEHLKDFQADNDEFRRSLTSLTELVNNLQIRVGNLEAGHVDPQVKLELITLCTASTNLHFSPGSCPICPHMMKVWTSVKFQRNLSIKMEGRAVSVLSMMTVFVLPMQISLPILLLNAPALLTHSTVAVNLKNFHQ